MDEIERLTRQRAFWAFKAGKAEGTLWQVKKILDEVEEFCDQHDEDDPITCGWKRTVMSIRKIVGEFEFTHAQLSQGPKACEVGQHVFNENEGLCIWCEAPRPFTDEEIAEFRRRGEARRQELIDAGVFDDETPGSSMTKRRNDEGHVPRHHQR